MICGKSFAIHLTSFIFLTKLCRGIVTTRTPSSPLKQLTFTRIKPIRRTGHSMSDWDAENGVWLGDRATSDDQLPSPLYLFGYGSLLWRPGDLLGNFASSACSCDNWQRLFAQRSSDHRGSPEFPGFVATLVEATYLREKLQELSLTNEELKRGIDQHAEDLRDNRVSCSGLVWLIPEDRIKGTISELDYRERGGYHRHIVSVTLKEDTQLHSAGTVVDALVYSGSTSNPNFHFIPSGCRFESQGIATGTLVRPHSATADIIAAAVGPSGSNSDYLFNLDDYLHENGVTDEYIYDLSAAVALRMGPWRARPSNRYLKHTAKTLSLTRDLSSSALLSTAASSSTTEAAAAAAAAAEPSSSSSSSQSLALEGSRSIIPTEYQGKENHFTAYLDTGYLIGWGSNEYLQLGAQTPLTHPDLLLQSAPRPILLSRTSCDISTKNTDSLKTSMSLSAVQSQGSNFNDDISFCQVLCGGASSAFLGPLGDLNVWGKIAQSEKNCKNATAVMETENRKGATVIQKAEGESSSAPITPVEDDSRLMFKDIVGAAIGHDHLLLLTNNGWVVPLGDNHWGQCQGPKSFVRMGSMNGKASSSSEGTGGAREGRVTGASAEGDNARNGKSSAGSNGDEETRLLNQEPEVQVLKLACGVRHSAAVTTEGYLHVWGSGSAASIVLPAHSDADAPAYKGEAVNTAGAHHPDPLVPVTWRPDDAKLIDVSCGMEQTVTIDDRGRVWSFGSNKHGSLGRSVPSTTQENVPVNSDPIPRTVIENTSQENGKVKTRKVVEKDSTPRLVEGLEPNVRWQRVSCGWSHTVVRGVRVDGSVASAAWGRRNLGQYPAEDSTQEVVENNKESESVSSKLVGGSVEVEVGMEGLGSVRPLHSPQGLVLPPGLTVREVWSGSEFSVVADQHGYLWATGWNEHGNLGRDTEGLAFVSSDGWVKVMHSDKSLAAVNGKQVMEGREGASDRHVRLSVVWEGAVSCGGGHILALTGHMSHT